LTATLSLPLACLEDQGPHQRESFGRWNPAPELGVERAVVVVQAHDAGGSSTTFIAAIHRC
jgi:hypothetical protein